mgnify:CR=1 FL=1
MLKFIIGLFTNTVDFIKKHEKNISKAMKIAERAQHTFASALEDAELANEKLEKVIKEVNEQIAKLEAVLENTRSQKELNDKFKEKLLEFMNK